MAYQMVATAVTLNDIEGHSPVADVFTCNPSPLPILVAIGSDVFGWWESNFRLFH